MKANITVRYGDGYIVANIPFSENSATITFSTALTKSEMDIMNIDGKLDRLIRDIAIRMISERQSLKLAIKPFINDTI